MRGQDIAVGIAALGLIAVALVLTKEKKVAGRHPGSPTWAVISFKHFGPGGSFDTGFGVAPGRAFLEGHDNVQHYFGETVVVPAHSKPTGVSYTLKAQPWPSVPPGKYDALKFVQVKGGARDPSGAGFILADWDDDIYTAVE